MSRMCERACCKHADCGHCFAYLHVYAGKPQAQGRQNIWQALGKPVPNTIRFGSPGIFSIFNVSQLMLLEYNVPVLLLHTLVGKVCVVNVLLVGFAAAAARLSCCRDQQVGLCMCMPRRCAACQHVDDRCCCCCCCCCLALCTGCKSWQHAQSLLQDHAML